MAALTDARHDLADALKAAGLKVVATPSAGHLVPPVVMVAPGAEWVIVNAQLGADLHSRVALTVTCIAGRIAAEKSLTELEGLIESALPILAGRRWTLTAIGQPFAMQVAATEYLAASLTLVRQIVIPAAAP